MVLRLLLLLLLLLVVLLLLLRSLLLLLPLVLVLPQLPGAVLVLHGLVDVELETSIRQDALQMAAATEQAALSLQA
jgi:hypothetical protein